MTTEESHEKGLAAGEARIGSRSIRAVCQWRKTNVRTQGFGSSDKSCAFYSAMACAISSAIPFLTLVGLESEGANATRHSADARYVRASHIRAPTQYHILRQKP